MCLERRASSGRAVLSRADCVFIVGDTWASAFMVLRDWIGRLEDVIVRGGGENFIGILLGVYWGCRIYLIGRIKI